MESMTIGTAFGIGEDIFYRGHAKAQESADARRDLGKWIDGGMPLSQSKIPDLVKRLQNKIGCNMVAAAHLSQLILGNAGALPWSIMDLPVVQYPAYIRLKAFFSEKVHAKNSSGHAWHSALYGRKLRGKSNEYRTGLVHEIGEFQALAAFYVLNFGIKGIKQLRDLANIQWSDLRVWLAAAIRRINKYKTLFFAKLKSMMQSSIISDKDFCLEIFRKADAAKGKQVAQSKSEEMDTDEADESDDMDLDDNGDNDYHDPDNDHETKRDSKRKKDLEEQRADAYRIIHDTLHNYLRSDNPRLTRIASLVDPTKTMSALFYSKYQNDPREPSERITNFLTAIWDWATGGKQKIVSANSLALTPEKAIASLTTTTQKGYARTDSRWACGHDANDTKLPVKYDIGVSKSEYHNYIRSRKGLVIEIFSESPPLLSDFACHDPDLPAKLVDKMRNNETVKCMEVIHGPNDGGWVCRHTQRMDWQAVRDNDVLSVDADIDVSPTKNHLDKRIYDTLESRIDTTASSCISIESKEYQLLSEKLHVHPQSLAQALQGDRQHLASIIDRIEQMDDIDREHLQNALHRMAAKKIYATPVAQHR